MKTEDSYPNRHRTWGYIYLFQNPRTLEVKIGATKRLKHRLAQISKREGVACVLLHSIPTNHYFQLEHAIHDQFAECRVRGEWFKLSDADIAILRGIDVWMFEDDDICLTRAEFEGLPFIQNAEGKYGKSWGV